jgi:hypothetical protein
MTAVNQSIALKHTMVATNNKPVCQIRHISKLTGFNNKSQRSIIYDEQN